MPFGRRSGARGRSGRRVYAGRTRTRAIELLDGGRLRRENGDETRDDGGVVLGPGDGIEAPMVSALCFSASLIRAALGIRDGLSHPCV